MSVETNEAGRERIVCDGCGRGTVWYDASKLRTDDVRRFNNIRTISHEGIDYEACEGCRGRVEQAMGAVVAAAVGGGGEHVVEGPPDGAAQPPMPSSGEPAGASQPSAPCADPVSPYDVEERPTVERPLVGVAFCITGRLSVTRDEFTEMITDFGGEVYPSVSENIDYLVHGDTGRHGVTAKQKKADQHGVEVIDEAEFWDCVEERRKVIDAEWEVVEDKDIDEAVFDVPRLPAPLPGKDELDDAFEEADAIFNRLEEKLV